MFRVLLSQDDLVDMRAIADKADRLISMHMPQGQDAYAAVAAVRVQILASGGGYARHEAEKFMLPAAQRPQQQQKS